jgi:hypothetical protein
VPTSVGLQEGAIVSTPADRTLDPATYIALGSTPEEADETVRQMKALDAERAERDAQGLADTAWTAYEGGDLDNIPQVHSALQAAGHARAAELLLERWTADEADAFEEDSSDISFMDSVEYGAHVAARRQAAAAQAAAEAAQRTIGKVNTNLDAAVAAAREAAAALGRDPDGAVGHTISSLGATPADQAAALQGMTPEQTQAHAVQAGLQSAVAESTVEALRQEGEALLRAKKKNAAERSREVAGLTSFEIELADKEFVESYVAGKASMIEADALREASQLPSTAAQETQAQVERVEAQPGPAAWLSTKEIEQRREDERTGSKIEAGRFGEPPWKKAMKETGHVPGTPKHQPPGPPGT